MSGRYWRLLLVRFQEIIIPAITDPQRKQQYSELFSYLCDIQFISYCDPSAQAIPGIRLRLNVLCFLVGAKVQQLYTFPKKSTSGCLYLHTMISHYGE